MVDEVGVGIEFNGGGTPNIAFPPTPANSGPKFIAKPGSPRAMRIITASRSKTMGGMGQSPQFTNWGNRELITSDTLSAFAPMYQKFANEFAVFKKFTPQQLESVVAILEAPRTHDMGLINELEHACPGIADALYSVLLPQYSRGESGIRSNILTLGDADILQRFNAFGFGTQLRAEMLTIIHNSYFFNDISVDIKDKDIKIIRTSDNTTLVEGNVDDNQKLVTLKINGNLDPADRDDAIKHLIMMAACHAQQNNSNSFLPTFGDNIYENIRLLQLAIGEFNLHIPEHCIASQLPMIQAQISAISDPTEQQKAQDAWDLWSKRAETFKDKISIAGTKIINNDYRPKDAKGYYMNLVDTQQMLRNEVTESIFPSPATTPNYPGP